MTIYTQTQQFKKSLNDYVITGDYIVDLTSDMQAGQKNNNYVFDYTKQELLLMKDKLSFLKQQIINMNLNEFIYYFNSYTTTYDELLKGVVDEVNFNDNEMKNKNHDLALKLNDLLYLINKTILKIEYKNQ